MHRNLKQLLIAGLMIAGTSLIGQAADAADVTARMQTALANGHASREARAMATELESAPADDTLRYAAGVLHFCAAVETLGQSWYRHGLRPDRSAARAVPFLRLPVPENPSPDTITAEQARRVLEQFADDLARAESILAGLEDSPVKLPFAFDQVSLDLDGDGQATEAESLWTVFTRLNRRAMATATDTNLPRVVVLDQGDAYWLRGYCHLLSGLLDFYLTYDHARLFDHTAHLFFARPLTPYPFLAEARPGASHDLSAGTISDFIALVHLLDFPVLDASRGAAAREHLLQTVALSRLTWAAYAAETDDDHEWIPNPRQTGVVPGVQISEDMIASWHAFLDEAERLLNGTVLLPFWRGSEPMGVNLERVLMAPQPFDLVLWVQGPGALPYLERGPVTDPGFWRRLMTAFDGRFVGFALWFN